MTRLLIALIACIALSGCSTLNTTKDDMIEASQDFDLAADKIDSGELDADKVPPFLRQHARTLRAWAGAPEPDVTVIEANNVAR